MDLEQTKEFVLWGENFVHISSGRDEKISAMV